MEPTNQNLKWAASEFTRHDKSAVWYIGFFILASGLVAYAIYTRNMLTLITFLVSCIVLFILAHQRPRQINYELTGADIRVGNSKFKYRNIKKYWIIYSPENKSVNFETTAYLNNVISIPLGKMDPVVVKRFLKNYLPEDLDKEETMSDILARKVKF